MKVLSLVFHGTGGYQPMVYRPYTALLPSQDQKKWITDQTRPPDRPLNSESELAKAANIFLRPGKQAVTSVFIPNGWENPRTWFTLAVDHGTLAGYQHLQILTGYTDHLGIDPADNIDPNMRLYFNRSIHFGKVGQEIEVRSAHQVLVDSEQNRNSWQSGARTLCPRDIFGELSLKYLTSFLREDIIDVRSAFGVAVKFSHAGNAIPGTYLHRLLTAYAAAMESSDEYDNDVFQKAMLGVDECSLSRDKFFTAVAATTDFSQNGFIAFRELTHIPMDFTLDQVTFCHVKNILAVEDKTIWTFPHPTTQAAVLLGNAVPAILALSGMQDISFTATNDTRGKYWEVCVQELKSFWSNPIDSHEVNRLIQQLKTIVLPHLTFMDGRRRLFTLNGRFSVVGDSFLTIKVANSKLATYRIPSFADSRFSPVISNNQEHLKTFASRMGEHLEFLINVPN